MITYKLEKYRSVYERPVQQQHQGGTWHQASPLKMEKLEFALWLKTLPFQKGDILAFASRNPPYSDYDLHIVVDIDEIHKFVDWGTLHSGPKVLRIATRHDKTGLSAAWAAGPKFFKKVPQDQWTQGWVDYKNNLILNPE